jgi:hypothetical protein
MCIIIIMKSNNINENMQKRNVKIMAISNNNVIIIIMKIMKANINSNNN